MNALIEELKENEQDFEFYPTTKEIIGAIFEHRMNMGSGYRNVADLGDVLDIGCGTCNFRKFITEFNQKIKDDKTKYDSYGNFRGDTLGFGKYYVMEKSKILLDRLDSDVVVLGTDFNTNTLMDKKVDTIFCNPPYSQFELWTKRIITESNCKDVYLIIPERWKENKDIIKTLDNMKAKYKVIGSFDFLHAERQARAKIDIVYIDKSEVKEDLCFDTWFDEVFKMRDKTDKSEFAEEREKKENLKSNLVNAESKVGMLVQLYQDEQKTLFEHFTAISSLDIDILESIGVSKKAVKASLKHRCENLKNLYWEAVFDNLEEITDRLTTETRRNMLNKFTGLKQVDFTPQNIYSLIIWVIKNANQYYNEQLIDFFKKLSSEENVKAYKSNHKTFTKERWRFMENNSHYTLDYRIVCDEFHFGDRYSWRQDISDFKVREILGDICTIANNLGFIATNKDIASEFGQKYNVFMGAGKILFEYKYYKNGNTHIKFNKEFIKAMNVEVSRLLGWIKCKEDIAKEFTPEMADGAEKYFKANNFINLTTSNIMLLEAKTMEVA